MKNLFDAAVADEIKNRVARLEPHTERLWGKMTAAQMLAHSAVSMQCAVGELEPAREALPMRLIARLVKPMMFRDEGPFRKNSPTSKGLIVADERDLVHERDRLLALIGKFAAAGAPGCTRHPHSFFGKLTPEQWAILTYKHLDHHLRQFGV
jgi:transposase InsO family protein